MNRTAYSVDQHWARQSPTSDPQAGRRVFSCRLLVESVACLDSNGPRVSVQHKGLTALNPLGDVASADHRGNTVFPGHNGAMAKDAPDVGHKPDSVSEELCPGGGCHGADQDGPRVHPVELLGIHDPTCRRGNRAGTDGDAAQGIARVVVLELGFLELQTGVLTGSTTANLPE